MLEIPTAKKQKINLNDYPYQQDLQSRFVLSDLSAFDLTVLEEILYNPLKVSVKKLCRTLEAKEADLEPILTKLESCGLFERQCDTLLIDKEKRKYLEFQISRFADGFSPNMEFFQGLLKQIPIHLLPSWYAIPRSSNNIFESIVEKYLLTPHIYQRYLQELHFPNPAIHAIMRDVFASRDLKISSSDLIAKHNLARKDFDLIMLQLELHLACFVSYIKEDDHWHEIVTPFSEWRDHILLLRSTETTPIEGTDRMVKRRESPFAFVEDMGAVLSRLEQSPIPLYNWIPSSPLPLPLCRELAALLPLPLCDDEEICYLTKILEKLLLVRLAERSGGSLRFLESASDWLSLNLENRALHLYRHPLNRLIHHTLPPSLCAEKPVREAEKSVKRTLHGRWVFFDEFLKGVFVPLNDDSAISLKRQGKHWKFALPAYTAEEKTLIEAVVFDWLFECGMIAVGKLEGRNCFSVTAFGQFFFED